MAIGEACYNPTQTIRLLSHVFREASACNRNITRILKRNRKPRSETLPLRLALSNCRYGFCAQEARVLHSCSLLVHFSSFFFSVLSLESKDESEKKSKESAAPNANSEAVQVSQQRMTFAHGV